MDETRISYGFGSQVGSLHGAKVLPSSWPPQQVDGVYFSESFAQPDSTILGPDLSWEKADSSLFLNLDDLGVPGPDDGETLNGDLVVYGGAGGGTVGLVGEMGAVLARTLESCASPDMYVQATIGSLGGGRNVSFTLGACLLDDIQQVPSAIGSVVSRIYQWQGQYIECAMAGTTLQAVLAYTCFVSGNPDDPPGATLLTAAEIVPPPGTILTEGSVIRLETGPGGAGGGFYLNEQLLLSPLASPVGPAGARGAIGIQNQNLFASTPGTGSLTDYSVRDFQMGPI